MIQTVSICVCLSLMPIFSTCWAHVIPRLSFPLGSPGRSLAVFSSPDVSNSTTLLLSNDEGTLFVGARDAVMSIDVSQAGTMTMKEKIDWSPPNFDLNECLIKGNLEADCHNFVRVLQVLNSTHMYACGTFAFNPRCIYINSNTFSVATGPSGKPEEGRGRCPYNPYQRNTAITVDGELYTGTMADYMGNRPVISRHLSEGSHVDLKLDDTPGWLEDPTFISSTYIPSEAKVYFFFSETGNEYDFIDKFSVSRIAQVCTSDVGGQRTLQKRWTTFAKAQLRCQAAQELPYNILQDIVSVPAPEGASEEETLFFGIFGSQWRVNAGRSAICAFTLKNIKEVFAGNYKYLNRDAQKWTTRVQEKMANPGECGLHNASDNTLRFVKENFLADESVMPANKGLTLVSPDQSYRNIAAQRVRGARGKVYTVLYLLTESGYLHKAVILEKGAHIIEEIQVYNQPQPVTNLLLSISRGAVLIGYAEGVVSVPLSNCSYHWSCAECILARDPFCGWDPGMKVCTDATSQQSVVQDVDGGNVSEQCKSAIPRSRASLPVSPSSEVLSVSLNEVVHLQCPEASQLAKRYWERPNSQLSPKIYIQLDNGSLSFVAIPSTLGPYQCQAEENGYTQTLVIYHVQQKRHPTNTQAAPTPSHQPHIIPDAETESRSSVFTTKWTTPGWTMPQPKPESTEPTVTQNDTPVLTTSRSRNFTHSSVSEEKKSQMMVEPGGNLEVADKPTYLKELVVVSVLLALCISALLTIALYRFRLPCPIRTFPQTLSPRRDAERGESITSQERESLREQSPHVEKLNGQSHNGEVHNGKSPITLSNNMLNGSNGHLPNTPI
ncbi:semaphorin-4A isoform X1 [Paramisgurnus dabryanus]|uniref:semaphorin-4A isoform X1 n=1 Tax=Paramisgurnus dabryanus TaxID=90735 RepID=UPI0031F3CABC